MTQEDKDIVIAEIERLEVEIPYHENAWSVLNKLKVIINTLPTEQPSEDLKKEIDRFQKAKYGGDVISVASIACHFAIWQKEQMMKTAIDAIITSRWKDSHVCLTTNKDIPQIYNGDRVKIIIVKEDEQ